MKQNIFNLIVGSIGGIISFLYGDLTTALYILVAMMCIDFFSGVINAIMLKELNSIVAYRGLAKKVYILLLVALAHLADVALKTDVLKNVTIFFYIANEGISILENACKIGLPIPQQIQVALEQLKGDTEE